MSWRANSYPPELEPLWRWLVYQGQPYSDKPRSGPEPAYSEEVRHVVDVDSGRDRDRLQRGIFGGLFLGREGKG